MAPSDEKDILVARLLQQRATIRAVIFRWEHLPPQGIEAQYKTVSKHFRTLEALITSRLQAATKKE